VAVDVGDATLADVFVDVNDAAFGDVAGVEGGEVVQLWSSLFVSPGSRCKTSLRSLDFKKLSIISPI